ncbi:SCO2522 family protein [Nocardia sp. NPDC003482]
MTIEEFGGYSESTENTKMEEVALSHLSIETGHFYMSDLRNGEDNIRSQFQYVARLVDFHTQDAETRFGKGARVSTCFLIDDFFGPSTKPAKILDKLLGVAAECKLSIDYLAREAGCALAPVYVDGLPTTTPIPLADVVTSRLVPEPIENTSGKRPPDIDSGWMCNGRRSSDFDPIQAMRKQPYREPVQNGRREHSIFLDVQLWDKVSRAGADDRRWSCPLLAAVWQLLRLGMLRYNGAAVARPHAWKPSDGWPDTWSEMPTVTQLNPAAKPFAAYRALSILPRRYLGIEHAVHTILDHVDIDRDVYDQIMNRAARESVTVRLPRDVTDRLSIMLLDEA